jgi:hypothetical protein
MSQVEKQITLNAAPIDVWATIRPFGTVDQYLPPVEAVEVSGSGPGMKRIMTLADGVQVTEQLQAVDDEARELQYTIVEAPLPLTDYTATMRVQPAENGSCTVTWGATFTPDGAPEADVQELLGGLYEAGLEGLQKIHG